MESSNDKRKKLMKLIRDDGYTLRAIGEMFGVSREYVRSIVGNSGRKAAVSGRVLPPKIKAKKRQPTEIAFLRKIIIADGCWLWDGPKTKQGYGILSYNGKRYYAHRLSYEYFNGSVQEGLEVCHHCDNPECVNPGHLFIGTHADNMHDRDKKGRGARMSSQRINEIKMAISNSDTLREVIRKTNTSYRTIHKILEKYPDINKNSGAK